MSENEGKGCCDEESDFCVGVALQFFLAAILACTFGCYFLVLLPGWGQDQGSAAVVLSGASFALCFALMVPKSPTADCGTSGGIACWWPHVEPSRWLLPLRGSLGARCFSFYTDLWARRGFATNHASHGRLSRSLPNAHVPVRVGTLCSSLRMGTVLNQDPLAKHPSKEKSTEISSKALTRGGPPPHGRSSPTCVRGSQIQALSRKVTNRSLRDRFRRTIKKSVECSP